MIGETQDKNADIQSVRKEGVSLFSDRLIVRSVIKR